MIKKQALKYLGITTTVEDESLLQLLDECIKEVEAVSEVKIYTELCKKSSPFYVANLALFNQSKTLTEAFKACDVILIVAATLGIQIDRKIKYYQFVDMRKAVVFDAVSSAYLEAKCDAYEVSLDLGKRTFRYAPGYGDIALHLNRVIAEAYQLHKKIGVSVSAHDLLVPMKSMIGLIGMGSESKQSCQGCVVFDTCQIRERGETCY